MSLPNYVKLEKDGVTYESGADRVNWTLNELIRAALRDVGKFVCKNTRKAIRKRTGRLAKNTQYWVRTKQKTPNLQVGFKPGGFYGGFQETGTSKIPKIGALSNSVNDNIDEIMKIQGAYLSAIEDEQKAEELIDEGEYQGE